MADDKAERAAEKARAKAMRPWYKKKRFIIPLILVGLIVISTVSGGGDKKAADSPQDAATGTSVAGSPTTGAGATRLFPGRPDAKRKDQERNIGQSANLSGYTATVTAAAFQQQLDLFSKNGYLVAQVTLLNPGLLTR